MKNIIIVFSLFLISSVFIAQCVFPAQNRASTTQNTYLSQSSDPIVGRWYAPQPDDLTFEFYSDGTFKEQSPRWGTYNGKWIKTGSTLYSANIKDGFGAPKSASFLYSGNQLMTGGITILQRI